MPVHDFLPALRRAIALAREAGLAESATELEGCSTACYTTGTEMLGEIGLAILRFRSKEGERVPREVIDLLDECQREIGKVWPRFKPGFAGWFWRWTGLR
jgi:hypothetical protein